MLKKIVDIVYEMLESFAISLAIFLAVYIFIAFPEVVVGASMEPTLHTGDRLIVERLSAKFHNFKRGDIVILNPPGNNNVDYVKRIVGLPGESIQIVDCNVFLIKEGIERVKIDESYVESGSCTKSATADVIKIPKDSYFVLGDNREHSADSRYFGTLSSGRVDGKVLLRFWPLNKVSSF